MLFRSDLEQLDKQSDSLMKKDQMPDTKQDQQNIDNQMNSSSDQLSINQNSKASQSQKNASDQMKQLAEKMESASSASYEQQDELDMDAIKQILENLVKASIDQEQLINDLNQTNVYNPKYLDIIKQQHSLNDDVQMIEDSIIELSKKVFEIQS